MGVCLEAVSAEGGGGFARGCLSGGLPRGNVHHPGQDRGVCLGVFARGCLPRGCLPRGDLPRGGYLPRERCTPPSLWTDRHLYKHYLLASTVADGN